MNMMTAASHELSRLIRETADKYESSWVPKQEGELTGRYTITIEEAARAVCGEENALWSDLIWFMLYNSWNDVLDWATNNRDPSEAE